MSDAVLTQEEADHAEWGHNFPQSKHKRLILPPPLAFVGTGEPDPEPALLAQLKPGVVMMMGDNPALPRMPKKPTLLDFFRLRFNDITFRHLLTSASQALAAGHE